ncbi:helix-turn-helix domain-containing protein [Nonomuraea typhae]|uniref:helix-turn-helix domain-containing protein n=1 Tax=Nonomuraea typhae TaxID=2603600 RepID=UPI0012F9B631|nr:helix-turn-helix transcriptional regulator [Nonomuraea typhae]
MGIETFGEALRRLRAGMSLRELAGLAHCSKTHIADLESGRRFPSMQVAVCLDKALGADGQLVALADRRQRAVLWPAASIAALPPVAALLADLRRLVDGDVVEELRVQLEASKAEDGALGPSAALPRVQSVLAVVQHSVCEVRTQARPQLLTVGAETAEFVGWLYRDLGDLSTATYWYDRAIEWAQEADNGPMQGYVLLRKSQLAYDQRDAMKVLTLAEAAGLERWQLPNQVRAEVAQQQARGYAMVGEPMDRVERALGEAIRWLDRFESDPDKGGTQLGSNYSLIDLNLRAASCHIEAGQPARAAELYHEVLKGESLSRRDQGYFLARCSYSLALAGQPDDAAVVGMESVQLANATNSLRTKRELGRAVRALAPWATRPGPRELDEALRA